MNNLMQGVIADLAKLINVPIATNQDAVVFKSAPGDEYWLECPDQSSLILFHTELKEFLGYDSSILQKDKWLSLNSQPNVLKGCYIGLHKDTNTTRLFFNIPIKYADVNALKNALDNLIEISKTIKSFVDSCIGTAAKKELVNPKTIHNSVPKNLLQNQLMSQLRTRP
jgi:hypothetical protein